VKFDGWRVQRHKAGREVAILSRCGKHLMRQFRQVAAAIAVLPVRSCLLDGELTMLGARAATCEPPCLSNRTSHNPVGFEE
jgi:ATP-dependent DNA ligase